MVKRKSTKNFQIVYLPHLVQNFALNEIPPTTNEMLAMRTIGVSTPTKHGKRIRRSSEYDRQKRIWTSKIIHIVETQKLIKYREPTWVNLLFFVDNRIDDDNLEGSRKFLLDGLVDSELIVDDSPKWLKKTTIPNRRPPLKGKDIKLIVTVSNRPIMKDLEPIRY